MARNYNKKIKFKEIDYMLCGYVLNCKISNNSQPMTTLDPLKRRFHQAVFYAKPLIVYFYEFFIIEYKAMKNSPRVENTIQ